MQWRNPEMRNSQEPSVKLCTQRRNQGTIKSKRGIHLKSVTTHRQRLCKKYLELGRCKYAKYQIMRYAEELDKSIDLGQATNLEVERNPVASSPLPYRIVTGGRNCDELKDCRRIFDPAFFMRDLETKVLKHRWGGKQPLKFIEP